jgi:hypothetical protein
VAIFIAGITNQVNHQSRCINVGRVNKGPRASILCISTATLVEFTVMELEEPLYFKKSSIFEADIPWEKDQYLATEEEEVDS